ncbi:MAG: amidohydrolase family protein [Spirochaetota bacterium]
MKYSGVSVFTGRKIEVEIEEGRIAGIKEIETKESLPYIAPGFLDMQVNGFSGSDYSGDDFSIPQFERLLHCLDMAGTTQHVPTIVTKPRNRIVENLKLLSRALRENPALEEAIAGIHVEGPFISVEDGPRGAHDRRFIRAPDFSEFQEWQAAAEGRIKVITLAPEKPGALEFIEKITRTGVIAAIGHTAGTPEIIREAVIAGATLSTHLGNGSHVSLPRLDNYIWEQLSEDRLMAGLIADGFHLPPSVVKVITRAKESTRIILVSDASPLGGLKPGIYRWGAIKVQIFDDGHLGLAGTPFLAGSGHLLDWCIPHFSAFTGFPIGEVIPLCTVNPARLLKLPRDYGLLRAGAPANLALFKYNRGDACIKVIKTIRGGKVVFSAA